MSAPLTVGLAGAAGALGRTIASALARDPALRIVPILRPGRALGSGVLAADLTEPDDCRAAALQCHVMISAAGPAARVQPPLTQACAETGRPFLDVSGQASAPTTQAAVRMVFGCGVMPGWSELLPALLVRAMAPGPRVEIVFAPGGPLGPAGMADYLGAAATDAARFGTSLFEGRRVTAPAAAGRAPYLSQEAERFSMRAELGALLAETETGRSAHESSNLHVTARSPDGRTEWLLASASGAAAYSIAALRLCLRLLGTGRLPEGPVDFGALEVDADEALAVLAGAGVGVTRGTEADPAETGFL